jgi:long-chain acyl-CoA synthetase
MLYYEVLAKTAGILPDVVAVIFEDRAITYSQLKQQVDIVAENLWREGIRQGDFLSTYLPNSVENLVFLFACFKLGAISVPIRSKLQADHINHIVNDAKPIIIVTTPELAPELKKGLQEKAYDGSVKTYLIGAYHTQDYDWCHDFSNLQVAYDEASLPLLEIDENMLATVLYTSGSTGNPKGAVHDHGQWLNNISIASKNFNVGDVTHVALSINHSYGLGEQILAGFLKGITIILSAAFNADYFIKLVTTGLDIDRKTYRVNSFYGGSSMYHALVEEYSEIPEHSLKYLDVAGDTLPVVIKDKIITLFGPIIWPSYGMSEAMCISEVRREGSYETSAIGELREGVSIKIFKSNGEEALPGEIGELCIKGKSVCRFYLNSDKREQDTIAGYFKTGDVVYSNDGQLVYVNRIKRIIVTETGYKINPSDIETVINTYAGVKQSCAFDIYSETGQTLIVALAVLLPVDNDISARMIFDLFQEVEKNHRPSVVSLVDEFPHGSTGKIKWHFLKEQAQVSMQSPVANSERHFDIRNTEPSM